MCMIISDISNIPLMKDVGDVSALLNPERLF